MAISSSLGELFVELGVDDAEFMRAVEGAESRMQEFSNRMKPVAIAATAVFAAGTLAINKFVDFASDATENMNVLETSFKDLTPTILTWAQTTSDAMNRSALQMEQFAARMQSMLDPMTGNTREAAKMSLAISQLAVDMGSFFNVADIQALTALRSALAGETEPMKRFGVVMTEAALAQFALNKGIEQSVKTMTIAQKTTLRYQFIMESTKLAQGDAAKTSETYANALKGLKGALTDIAVKIGKELLPAQTELVILFRDTAKWVKDLSPEILGMAAKILSVGTAVAGVVAVLAGFAVALPSLVAGFALISTAVVAIAVPLAAVVGIIGGAILLVGAFKKAWNENLFGIKKIIISHLKFLSDQYGKFFKWLDLGWNDIAKGLLRILRLAAKASALVSGLPWGDAIANMIKEFEEGIGKKGVGKPLLEAAGKIKDVIGESALDVKNTFVTGLEAIKVAAKKAGLDISAWLPDFEKAVNQLTASAPGKGAPTTGGAVISGPLARVAPVLTNVASDISIAAQTLGESMLNAAGEAGVFINSIRQGFQAGGPWGAIMAAFSELAKRTDGFNDSMGQNIAALDSLAQVISPITQLVADLGWAIAPLIKLIERLSVVIQISLDAIFMGIPSILRKAREDKEAETETIVESTRALADQMIAINESKMAANEGMKTSLDYFDKLVRGKKTMRDLNEEVEKVTASMLNVPHGYKVALARFRATEPLAIGDMGGITRAGREGQLTSSVTTNIGELHLHGIEDPDDFYDKFKKRAAWDNFTFAGSSVVTAK